MFEEVTIIIKTFERPKALRKLLLSINKYYSKEKISILIADDSRETFEIDFKTKHDITIYKLPFDSGVSSGRNFLLEKVSTEYFITLDDDFLFCAKTKIEDFINTLKIHKEIDLAAGIVFDFPKHWWQKMKKRNISRTVSISDDVLRRSKTPAGLIGDLKIFNFLPQFFIAKTDKIKNIRWNDYLKTVEHTAFFLDCAKNGIISVEVPSVIVYHDHLSQRNKFYKKFRNDRVNDYIAYLHREYNYNKEIEIE